MHREDIKTLLRHLWTRQEEAGPDLAFRFTMFMGPKRKRLFAEYPSDNQSQPTHTSSARRKGKQKEVGQPDVLHPITGSALGAAYHNRHGPNDDVEGYGSRSEWTHKWPK